jgi:hypothetical protein
MGEKQIFLLAACFSLGLFWGPEFQGSMLVRNICEPPPNWMVLQPRKQYSSFTNFLPRKGWMEWTYKHESTIKSQTIQLNSNFYNSQVTQIIKWIQTNVCSRHQIAFQWMECFHATSRNMPALSFIFLLPLCWRICTCHLLVQRKLQSCIRT